MDAPFETVGPLMTSAAPAETNPLYQFFTKENLSGLFSQKERRKIEVLLKAIGAFGRKETTKTRLAKQYKVSRPTVYRWMKDALGLLRDKGHDLSPSIE
jgi:predicted transcriptional regulator YheO